MDWRAHIARFGTARIPGEPWIRWSFLALLVLAAVLRFWDLPNLPYTHDEISALIRIYPTLGETIQKGVIELDTHPPGVQVFEWLWTRVFSMEEADVKLPFILMDLLALFLLYRFALAWTGNGPALLLTTMMATLQYSVLYGQIARPYAAGLFTTALLADQLTRYLAFGQRRMLIGAGIAALLSAYTHHFALMLAALMVGTGLLLVPRQKLCSYIIMCGVVLLLYLPNVPIFFKQFGQGGLTEWLQAPDASWFGEYAWFVANTSGLLAGLLVACCMASLVLFVKNRGTCVPALWFPLLWGALPLAIGYAYSVLRAPVLQYSVVLFSFPYLVLFLAQGLAHVPRKIVLVGCGVIAVASVHSLVNKRLHYELFYRSKYEAMLREGIDAVKEHGKERTLLLFDAPDNVLRFYLDLWKVPFDDIPYVQLRDRFGQGQLDSLLVLNKGRMVVFGQSNGSEPEELALIQQRFPFLVDRQDLVDGQVFRFSDAPPPLQWFDRDTIASLSPLGRSGPWQIAGDLALIMDSVPGHAYWDYTDHEFGLGIDLPLDSIVFSPEDQVEVITTVSGWDPRSEASIVADLRSGDSTVFYRGGKLDAKSRPDGDVAMVVSISPTDIHGDSLLLRAYIYDPNKAGLRVSRIDVLRRQANPVRYGTLEPVHWRGRFPAK